ncbi:MAG: GNAT family N-acetyltransferase [Planctomycetes bacterium]|nr:GNAT family N-acetyltransferase [Planctomycetota bacterium]
MEAYQILTWDSDFFGFTVARINSSHRDGELEHALSELRTQNVRLAYWSTAEALDQVDRDHITQLGGRFVDEKTTFHVDLQSDGAPAKQPVVMAPVVEKYREGMSREDLRALAIQSGEYSRFAVDPNIPRAKFEELYTIWMEKSLTKEMAEEVLMIRDPGNRVVAMTTVGKKGTRGDIGLVAVDINFRGRQYGELLVRHALNWFDIHKYRYVQVVTQGVNTAACRLYAKCGFAVEKKEHFYHFWL